jgi:excisionase family DNA binding protein
MTRLLSTVLTIDELSSYVKVPKSTLYRLARNGGIPCQKVGKHWRFHKEAVDSWLADRSQAGPFSHAAEERTSDQRLAHKGGAKRGRRS